MSLDLNQLIPQIRQMSKTIIDRSQTVEARIPALQAVMQQGVPDSEKLQKKKDRAGKNWGGALPSEEPIQQFYPPPPTPESYAVLGADGSQIYPNRHSLALYYLINTGSIRIQYGSGNVPEIFSSPQVFYQEDDLYPDSGGQIDTALINGKRDVSEMEELARLAELNHDTPTIALLDNGLLLWIAAQSPNSSKRLVDQIVQRYQEQMLRLKQSGTALAGVIDRPRSPNLVRLLQILQLPLEAISAEALADPDLQRLSDRLLLQNWLPEGFRTARLVQSSSLNEDFSRAGLPIEFFYLNNGFENQILRVEVPGWVAASKELLDLVHAGILQQCLSTGGFPYVLARAHELAVVTQPEQRIVEETLARELLQHGFRGMISRKQTTKQWLGGKKRHTL
ncbi:MAG: DNA double-strand break repair nuclease NurA [Anaerolineales bacterium]|nr:DNA double-strand break repair nuclease NurA [Anaerolineales bacterium]